MRSLLLAFLLIGAGGSAQAASGWYEMKSVLAPARTINVVMSGSESALGPTLTFTMPNVSVRGDTLTGYLRYDVAYQVQSRAWIDSSAAMLADSTTWARLWATVAAQMAPRVVASAWVLAGTHVTVPQPPVSPLEGQACYVVRAWTGVPAWAWSNVVAKSN